MSLRTAPRGVLRGVLRATILAAGVGVPQGAGARTRAALVTMALGPAPARQALLGEGRSGADPGDPVVAVSLARPGDAAAVLAAAFISWCARSCSSTILLICSRSSMRISRRQYGSMCLALKSIMSWIASCLTWL